MDMDWLERSKALSLIQKEYEWHKWSQEIPFLKFNSDYSIKIIPPFEGAIIRFVLQHNDRTISVYLDGYGQLGYADKPYWEIYCLETEDIKRFGFDEVDDMLQTIDLWMEVID